jgi:NADH dehydrogenase
VDRRLVFGVGLAAGAAAGVAVARARRAAAREAQATRLRSVPAARGRNIVILGAGFAGITAAAALARRVPAESGWRITLVDRRNYHLFTPLLYHAATGLVDPSHILFPVRSLTQAPHFAFREAVVQDVDLERQEVRLDDGALPYDVLVLALGSVPNYFGKEADLPGVLELKSVADAVAIRNRIIDAYEAAEVATDPEERRRWLTFVVVGGGATGVELIGAMRGLMRGTLARQYPNIGRDEPRLVLCEALPEILPSLPRDLAATAQRRLREMGIETRLGAPVERTDAAGVWLKGGEPLPAGTVVWAAGVRPSPLAEQLPFPRAKNGRILVDPFLQVEGVPNVYAVGDLAAREDDATGRFLPPSAAVAVQEGRALAGIVLDRLEGREARPFRYEPKGELISLGRHEAVAQIGNRKFTGLAAWIIWRAFYLSQLMGFKNRLGVIFDWGFAYAWQRDTARLDLCPPDGVDVSRESAAPLSGLRP